MSEDDPATALTDLQELDKFIANLKVMKGGSGHGHVPKKKGGDLTYLQELNTLITKMKGHSAVPSNKKKKGITDITNLKKLVKDWHGGLLLPPPPNFSPTAGRRRESEGGEGDDAVESGIVINNQSYMSRGILPQISTLTNTNTNTNTDTAPAFINHRDINDGMDDTSLKKDIAFKKLFKNELSQQNISVFLKDFTSISLNTDLLALIPRITDTDTDVSDILRAKMCFFAVLGGILNGAINVTEAQYTLIEKNHKDYKEFFSTTDGERINFNIPGDQISDKDLTFKNKLAMYEAKQDFLKQQEASA